MQTQTEEENTDQRGYPTVRTASDFSGSFFFFFDEANRKKALVINLQSVPRWERNESDSVVSAVCRVQGLSACML